MCAEKDAAARTDGHDGGDGACAPYGIVGRRLGHTWSPQIHAELGTVPYAIHELEPDEVEPFVRGGGWRGLNVTIPYKRAAAELADERTPRVEALGVANTLLRRDDGTVLAENTDVLGFAWMLARFCRRELGREAREALRGEKALVLGSGGASQAVQEALRCEEVGARVVVVSRTGDDNYENLLERHADAALVVNTTPVGMFPDCPASPLKEGVLERLGRLKGVLDVVYNPERTGLCLAAERAGIPFESGLAMLVAQALRSSELWQGRALDDALVERIEAQIRRQTRNVVFIGMPGAGKTACGKRLARQLGRPFVDIDDAIAAGEGLTSAQIIQTRGEDAFRDVETATVAAYGAKSGIVIACGGGVVTRERNYPLLHQNGAIVLVDRPLGELSSEGRPMSQAKGVERLAAERMHLYRAWADLTVECTGTADGDVEVVRGLLGL